jgi:F420-non-reducing hydrogenase small subunit
LIVRALTAAVAGEPFELPKRNLCDECHREKRTMLSHSAEFVSDSVYALMELESIDPDQCLLEQGVMCMGPMTREGCGAVCTAANVPCRGCSGASRREFEQGGKAVDALAAVLPAGALMYMEDLIGTGYRFSLPVSVFPDAIVTKEAGDA